MEHPVPVFHGTSIPIDGSSKPLLSRQARLQLLNSMHLIAANLKRGKTQYHGREN
jgi:hypothetical protein